MRRGYDKGINDLLLLVRHSNPIGNVFNPWRDVDSECDLSSRAPLVRARHLRHYLETRLKTARYLLVGEALGYQGGHFSGIAMTSERILLGYFGGDGIHPHDVLPRIVPHRTSRPDIIPKGFTEPTATIVWRTLMKEGVLPGKFVLWNTFPWHPFNEKKGMLSNRRPTAEEIQYGYAPLERILGLFPGAIVIALGKIAATSLAVWQIRCHAVRHPANGGAGEFRLQIHEILRKT